MSEGFAEGPVTVLFSDVEGSTDLRTRRGDTTAHRLLRDHEEIVRGCVADFGGREIKALGDGFMVAFGSARKALACAQAIQQRLEERNRASAGDEVNVRIGINTGEVIIEGDDLYGQAVNAAARIAARARGGEILVSDIVRQLAGSGPQFTFADRGRCRLKGFPDRWHLYALTPADTAAEPALRFADRTTFVGRVAERTQLCRRLDRATAGQGGLVLISGEPGVGKSRLTEEVAAEAAGRFRVGVGHCYESGRDLPYMPWVELIEAAMAERDLDELRRSFGDEAPEFARLVPALRRVLPDIPAPLELPPEQQRRYTFNSIRDYLARVSQAQPRLVILEDLQWADEPTLHLLEHLAERLPTMACLVVATHRGAPSDLTPQLTDTLSRLVRGRHVDRLKLNRHDESEVDALLRVLSGQSPPAGIRAAIHAETDGNVFFVEEVFRHLVESGRLLDEQGRFRTDVTIGELDVPANVRLVLDRRLDRLDEATRQALGVAAVAGRHLSFDLWEAISDLDSDDLIDAIDEAERAAVVFAEQRADQEEYWFGHELIRQTLLARLPPPRRRRHHLRVADALARLSVDDPAAQAGTIAGHLLQAGSAADPRKLFHYLVLAGERSLVSAAFEDAVRHLRRAASLADHVAPGQRADMLFQLGMAERGLAHPEAAVTAWSGAIALWAEQGDTAKISRICPVAAFSLVAGGHYPPAYDLAQQGLAALGDRAGDEGGPLLALSGFVAAIAGGYDDGMQCITQALDSAERLGDSVLAGYALAWKAAVHHVHMESVDCVESGLRAAEILRSTPEVWQLATVVGMAAFSLPALGRLDDARRAVEEARPLGERLGAHVTRMHCGRSLALVDWFETGDLDRLEAFARRDIQLCLDAGMPWVSWGWSWLGLAAFLGGDWDSALNHAAKAAELSPPGVIHGAEAALRLEYLAYAGHRDEAMATIAASEEALPRLGAPNGWGRWATLFSMVEALVVLDEPAAAAKLYPLVRWCAERTGSVALMQPDGRLVERTAGMAAGAASNWDVAEAHFLAALDQSEKLPHRPEQAHIRRFYAAMLLHRARRGDTDRAQGLLAEAEGLYDAMRMPKHIEMTRALRNQPVQ